MSEKEQHDLQVIYADRFAGKTGYRKKVWKVLNAYFGQWIPQEGTTLDLGAGYCEFINGVKSGRKYAMDLNPEVYNRAEAGIQILLQDCSDPWPLPDGTLDVVFTSNFLEHLPDKAAVRRTLDQAYRCLKPGGRLIAVGPNIKYVQGTYWDFFDHYVELTELSLSSGLTYSGFTIEKQIARFLPYTMSVGPQYPIVLVQLYLAMPAFWRIFGKQFLVIARKPMSGPSDSNGHAKADPENTAGDRLGSRSR